MRRAFLWIILLCCFYGVSPASAHANLIRSDPVPSASLESAPQTITLWFTEPLEPNFSSITLLDHNGDKVSTPPSAVDPVNPQQMSLAPGALPDGIYTVSWRATSAADGHPTHGSYAFGVGVLTNAAALDSGITESVPPLEVLVRWFNLSALALAVGSLAFACFISFVPHDSRMRRLIWIGWALVGVAGVLVLLNQLSLSADLSPDTALSSLGALLGGTRVGVLWIGRMTFWLIMGFALWRRWNWMALALGGLILLMQSLSSHSSAMHDPLVSVLNDWLHLAASALWIGGLAQFINVLLAMRGDVRLVSRTTAAFSIFARLYVVTLVVTGAYYAWMQVGTLDALLHTLYGRALLVKTILFLPLLLIAAVNLTLTARGLREERHEWADRLRGLVGAEIALATGIFLAVGVMTSANPAREVLASSVPPPDHTFSDFHVVDDMHVHLDVAPGWVGQNLFTVTLLDDDGNGIDDASLIRVRFDNQTQSVGQSELRPTLVGGGIYEISGANMSVPGEWRVRVSVQRPDKYDSLTDFLIDAQIAPIPSGLDMSVPLPGHSTVELLAGLVLLGVGGFVGVRAKFWRFTPVGLLATLLLVAGLLMVLSGVQHWG